VRNCFTITKDEFVLRRKLHGSRIVVLCTPGYKLVSQWAVWNCSAVFVPLCTTHPRHELEYVIKDTKATHAIYDNEFEVSRDHYPILILMIADIETNSTRIRATLYQDRRRNHIQ
jgi:long-subunit acyl-CoA synthetase (AMP-forming)